MIILAENENDINARNKKYNGTKDSRRFQLLGGIAPPLKNVKKRRFRKIIRKRHCEAPEVEKELKKLLRDDQGIYLFTSYKLGLDVGESEPRTSRRITPYRSIEFFRWSCCEFMLFLLIS